MDEPSMDLPVEAGRQGSWIISVLDNELVFRKVDGAHVQRISRSDAPQALEIGGLTIAKNPFIAARVPSKITFRLTPDQAAVIKRWLAPIAEEHVRVIVNRYVGSWSIPIGILYLIGNPWGAMTGVDIARVVAGLSLIAIGILGKVRPGRGVLLLNAGSCAIIALLSLLMAFREQNWWRLLLVGLLLVIANVSVQVYRLITSLSR